MYNILKPLTINSVISEQGKPLNYFIPSYQRGYRWDKDQVNELLDDIYEFEPDTSAKYYCLQPIVVKRREDESFEVIDGQQRLTTIFIILSYLKKKRFEIKLETRKNSQKFLKSIETITSPNYKYIDYYYISTAYLTVKEWFQNKEKQDESSIDSDMHTKLCKEVQVIWYEVNDPLVNPIDIFTRLNIGKIPLTDAELIKALLLNNKHFPDAIDQQSKELEKNRIAREWDYIEQKLSDNDFWYFLNNDTNDIPNRIDFLFSLYVTINGCSEKKQHSVFHTFQDYLVNKKGNSSLLWDEFFSLFEKVVDLYSDRILFHLIGYLIKVGYSLSEIIKTANSNQRSELVLTLKNEIKKHLEKQAPKGIEELSFRNKQDYDPLTDFLLIFNVISTLKEKSHKSRFCFSCFVNEKWSLEHIHAQNSDSLHEQKEWIQWIEDHIDTIDSMNLAGFDKNQKSEVTKIKKDYENTDKKKVTETVFLEFHTRLMPFFQESNEEELHDISNLALLSKDLNSALNNAVFARKRQKIIEMDKEGLYLLPATRNVFLKYYSKEMNNLPYWSSKDRESYLDQINEDIKKYIYSDGEIK